VAINGVFSIRKNGILRAPVDLGAGISHNPTRKRVLFPDGVVTMAVAL
jgi:hypothetical protein